MPYTTLVAGTTITSSWANASVRDQVVTPFATAAARDSAVTAPVEGMLAYLRDFDQFCFYTGSRWAPLPGTMVARGNRTSSSTTTTTEVGVIRASIAVKSGQVYLIKTSPLKLNSTVSADFVFARLRYTIDGSTPSTASTVLATVVGPTGTGQSVIPFVAKYVPSSDVTLNALLTVGRWSGTGTVGLVVDSVVPDIDLMIHAAGTDPTDTGVDV